MADESTKADLWEKFPAHSKAQEASKSADPIYYDACFKDLTKLVQDSITNAVKSGAHNVAIKLGSIREEIIYPKTFRLAKDAVISELKNREYPVVDVGGNEIVVGIRSR